MTVHVRNQAGERKTYEAGETFAWDEETGYLEIKDDDGDTFAVYPPGAWIGVYQELQTDTEEKRVNGARIWSTVKDIPEGVQFRDREGDMWRGWIRGQLVYRTQRADWSVAEADDFSPFTEVLS